MATPTPVPPFEVGPAGWCVHTAPPAAPLARSCSKVAKLLLSLGLIEPLPAPDQHRIQLSARYGWPLHPFGGIVPCFLAISVSAL
jgi:hypothetical protein